MKKIILSEYESNILKEWGSVEITRNGYDILIEYDIDMECGFNIMIINPYDKVVVK